MQNTDTVLYDLLAQNFLVTRTDKEGNITEVNDNFCQASGFERNELVGKPYSVVRHPDMDANYFANLWQTIKKNEPFIGTIKNQGKSGAPFWVRTIIYPEGDGYVAIQSNLTNEMEGHEKSQRDAIFFDILQMSMRATDLKVFFEQMLDRLFEIPWLSFQHKGGVMLNKEGHLRLFAHKGVGESLIKMCDRVDYGQCLCGLAAKNRELVFAHCVDHRHHNRPAGITPHGHYNLPIEYGDQLLGVLFLYVNHGHTSKPYEKTFLKHLGNLLATVIMRLNSEKTIRSLQTLVRHYTPSIVWQSADKAVQDELSELPSERKKLNFLFCDMKDFTRFSERASAEEVISTINAYFEYAVEIIYRYRGDIERFMGDSFFAVFEDGGCAATAAGRILKSFNQVTAARKEKGEVTVQFRMGLHVGEAVRGNVGGQKRKEFTVMGTAVNLASRLEGQCKPGQILISEDFYQANQQTVTASEPESFAVKGFEKEVSARYLRGVKPCRPVGV